MTASTNKQIMTAIFDKVAQGDGALFVEHLADDVAMTVTGQYSWSQTFRGKASVLNDLYGYVNQIIQTPRKTIAFNIVADGDYVVVEAKGEMTSIDGEPYNNDYCLIYQLKDNKIIAIREYQDSHLCERILGPYPGKAVAGPDGCDCESLHV